MNFSVLKNTWSWQIANQTSRTNISELNSPPKIQTAFVRRSRKSVHELVTCCPVPTGSCWGEGTCIQFFSSCVDVPLGSQQVKTGNPALPLLGCSLCPHDPPRYHRDSVAGPLLAWPWLSDQAGRVQSISAQNDALSPTNKCSCPSDLQIPKLCLSQSSSPAPALTGHWYRSQTQWQSHENHLELLIIPSMSMGSTLKASVVYISSE